MSNLMGCLSSSQNIESEIGKYFKSVFFLKKYQKTRVKTVFLYFRL